MKKPSEKPAAKKTKRGKKEAFHSDKEREIRRQKMSAEKALAEQESRAEAKRTLSNSAQHMQFLRSLKKRAVGEHALIVTCDIETKDGASPTKSGFTRPFLTGIYDGSETRQWRNDASLDKTPWIERHLRHGGCIDKMMRALLVDGYRGARIYAHNGGNFDFLPCISWLKDHQDEFEVHKFATQGPALLSFHVRGVRDKKKRKGKGRRKGGPADKDWMFVDSIRLLPMALKVAAKAFGCATQKQELDLDTHENDPRWEKYHAADLVSLQQCIVQVRKLLEEQGGEMMLTAPSAALRLFQRRYLKDKEKIWRNKHFAGCKDSECRGCAHEFVRAAYKGGRVEPFIKQGTRLFYYDINSSYPAAMLHPMPVGKMVVNEPKVTPWEHYQKQIDSEEWVIFARCTVTIPASCLIPPLPVHHPKTGKLVFPVGTFTGTWDGAEIALVARAGGTVDKVHKVIAYPADPVFRDMMKALYRMRDKSEPDYDEGLSRLAKLICNALYGKFGQRPERTEVLFPQGDVPIGAVPAGGDPFAATLWYLTSEEDASHIIPQIAAHVTSLGRVTLWNIMQSALKEGGRVYYTDTDSVTCDVPLLTSNELGGFKREYACDNLSGEFVRPKVYRLFCGCEGEARKTCGFGASMSKPDAREKLVAKGIPAKDVDGPVLDRSAWIHYTSGAGPVFFQRLTKLRSMAKEGLRSPWMVKTHKSMKSVYDKRVMHEDGTTTAIEISDAMFLPGGPSKIEESAAG